MTLTRADLQASRLQRMIREAGVALPLWSDRELQASIDSTLQVHPPGADLWIFAYGSLIWNPAFHYQERLVGKIYGWHRHFCLWTPLGRGTPDNPGLVLGLDRGGSCWGVVYRIAAADMATELLLLWRREMIVGSYLPRWVKVLTGARCLPALTFVINPRHDCYAGKLPLTTAVHHIATAHGQIGPCAEYLFQTVAGLTAAGIHDRRLHHLAEQVLQRQAIRA
ncbi:gamma-glutamylcyclotransferase [Trichothermofontia sp.]